MSLMAMSISGAVLILVILAVRAALKDRLPKRTFAVLWTAALLRLLIPFSVPFSWSAYTLLQNAASDTRAVLESHSAGNPQSESGTGSQGSSARNLHLESEPDSQDSSARTPQSGSEAGAQSIFGQSRQTDPGAESPGNLASDAQAGGQVDLPISSESISEEALPLAEQLAKILPALKGIWAAGFLACAIFFGWMYFRCYREFRMSLPFEDHFLDIWHSSHPLWRKLSIRQSDQIVSPLSYGVWHPVILLPKSAKCGDRFRLRYVLEHEYVHIRYFDAAVKLLMAAVLCIHWFNPCVYLMYRFFNRDLELACDEAVVHRFGEEQKSAYAMALIEMEEEKSGLLPLGNSFSKNAIEERIGAIMKMKKTPPFVHGLSAALVCGIILLFATSCGSYGEAEKSRETTLRAEAVDAEETNADNRVVTKSLSAALKESKQSGEAIHESALDLTEESKESTAKNEEENVNKLVQDTSAMDESALSYSRKELADRIADLDQSMEEIENELDRLDYLHIDILAYKAMLDQTTERNQEIQDIRANAGQNTDQEKLRREQEENTKQIETWKRMIEEKEKEVEQFRSNADDLTREIEQMQEERERLLQIESVLELETFFEEHYGKYGISFSQSEGRLYKGKTPVRFFIDEKEGGVLWADNNGEAVVRAVYDKEGKVSGVSVREADEDKIGVHFAEDTEETAAKTYAGNQETHTGDNSYRSAAYVISKGEEFEEYKKFGLSYDEKTDFLMYKNQTVGYFKDETKPNVYTRLAEGSGKLGITVNRDKNGKITDFSVFPFDESSVPDSSVSEGVDVKEGSGLIRWDDSGNIVSVVTFPAAERGDLEAYAAEQGDTDEAEGEATSGEGAYSEGDPNETETSLPKEYEKLGIKASKEKNSGWIYQGKEVAVIYDKDHWIYTNGTIPEKKAVYLEVVRDKKDRVTELKEVSKKEMQKLIDEN